MGRVPRPFRTAQAVAGHLRTLLRHPLHPRARIRCPLLRPDPAQRRRLTEISDNLAARIAEARREGWTGDAEGLKVSLAAARQKLAQMDEITARRETVVHLGMPGHAPAVSRTVTTPATLPGPAR